MTRSTMLASLSALLVLAASTPLLAQQDAKQTKEPGPSIGSTVKNFTLVDQAGKAREWKQFLGKGPVAIVFYRSANW